MHLYMAKMDGKRSGHREAQGGPQIRTNAGKPAWAPGKRCSYKQRLGVMGSTSPQESSQKARVD